MKKIIISILIIAMFSCIMVTNTSNAALQAILEVTADKTEVSAGEYVTFNFKVKNIANAAENSVTAAGGVISYNTNFFEKVDSNNCTGIVIDPETGLFNSVFSASSDKDIGSIKLKVKENPTGEGTVQFTELAASDGEEMAYTDDKNFTITIANKQEPDNNTVQNQVTNDTTNNTTNKVNTNNTVNKNPETTNKVSNTSTNNSNIANTANKVIPKAGISPILIVSIIIVAIIAVILYMNYRYYRFIK